MQSRQEQLDDIQRAVESHGEDAIEDPSVRYELSRLVSIVRDMAAELEVAKHMAVTASQPEQYDPSISTRSIQ